MAFNKKGEFAMHNAWKRNLAAFGVGAILLSTSTVTAFAAPGSMGGPGNQSGQFGGQSSNFTPGNQSMPGNSGSSSSGSGSTSGSSTTTTSSSSSPTTIVTSTVTNTAQDLTADESNATTYTMTDSDNEVKIEESGTYIVTGSCSDGNIIVKKGTTGVVLILKDLDLTSSTSAPVSCNKNTEVKIIIEGTVTLTDAEDPSDEESTDTDVADAFDGAALKAKDGSNVYLTGTGTLNIDSSSCKNGIKIGDGDTPSFVIDGSVTVNITAANDGINAGYDLTILGGTINVSAGDDGIHADRILTLGEDGGDGPTVTIKNSNEGLEGTVVNLFGGNGTINASDDGVNAANSDGTYSSEMDYSINITGGTWVINCQGDGLDSNGNINITGGSTTINSGSTGGEAGLDYTGSLYCADGCLTNYSGVSSDASMGGNMGGSTSAPGGNMQGPGGR